MTRWVAATPAAEIGTSVVVLAEIRLGIERKRLRDVKQGKAVDRWYRQMRDLLEDRVIPIDEPIAEEWARLSAPDPLPFVDGLLAATANIRRLTLVPRKTNDVARTGVRLLDPFSDP